MMGTTPLLDRIEARRKVGRIGPVSPVPITDKMSPFSKRLLEKRLLPKFLNGAFVPDGDGGAA
jgi:hypothetical protein